MSGELCHTTAKLYHLCTSNCPTMVFSLSHPQSPAPSLPPPPLSIYIYIDIDIDIDIHVLFWIPVAEFFYGWPLSLSVMVPGPSMLQHMSALGLSAVERPPTPRIFLNYVDPHSSPEGRLSCFILVKCVLQICTKMFGGLRVLHLDRLPKSQYMHTASPTILRDK